MQGSKALGLPESLLEKNDYDSLGWRQDFIKIYLERDISQHGLHITVQILKRFVMWSTKPER